MLNEQFQSVFTDENKQNLPSCKELFPDMTEINFDIDGVIKIKNHSKANGPDKVPARFLKETAMDAELCFIICYVSHTSMAHYHLIALMLWYALSIKRQEI